MSAPERRRYRDQMFKLFLFTSGSSFVAASLSWQKRFNTFMVLGAPNGFLLLTPLQWSLYFTKISVPMVLMWSLIFANFLIIWSQFLKKNLTLHTMYFRQVTKQASKQSFGSFPSKKLGSVNFYYKVLKSSKKLVLIF